MIKVMTSAERHTVHNGGIHGEFSFSFGEYEDPHNEFFGSLLAHNEYVLEPKQRMERSYHHDLIMVYFVLDGTLSYEDDTGERIELGPGSVYVVNTGTGVAHTQKNEDETRSVRYLQLWLLPEELGQEPTHHYAEFSREQRLNQLFPVASGVKGESGATLQLDARLYSTILETGGRVSHSVAEGRRVHLYVVNGNVEVTTDEGVYQLSSGDTARIHQCEEIQVKGIAAEGASEWIAIDLP
ncbi:MULTISPECIES: pirin family protein [Paenibacillus]|uniref:Pimeloyl-CoA dehydrogenase n=1 Tax=Paenibacillus campinasensis TaxID=66347 RepID=A0A268EMV5_9BACL|nr:pirin family protein [Paenibacillus campinasensis]PAD74449.1 pimeloyl-CoA dehydrogenase [Paenibacillus campinasensis]